jgi:hypothetical protein
VAARSATAWAGLALLTLTPAAIIATLAPVYSTLVESGQVRPIPPEAFYYMVTSGGGAKYALDGITRELFGAPALEPEQIDDYAEAVADLIVRGMSVTSHPG